MQTERKIKIYIAILLLVAIGSYWLLFIDKVGLHGDEAWQGVQAVSVLQNGFSRWVGMDFYTGALQSSLAAIVFKLFGVSITALRSVGIVANIVALFLVCRFLYKRTFINSMLFFSVLMFQSALFLGYAKVAFEVTSLNFLFLALTVVSLDKLSCRTGKNEKKWLFAFLTVTLLASYNHILFLALTLSVHIGLVLWMLYHFEGKVSSQFLKYYTATAISILNSSLLFCFLYYYGEGLQVIPGILSVLCVITLLLIESYYFSVLTKKMSTLLNKIVLWRPSILLKLLILAICTASFFKFHVYSFYRVHSHEVIFNRLFSYRLSREFHLGYMGLALVVFSAVFYVLVKDVFSKNRGPWAYIFIVYLGSLAVFSSGYSIRYYLVASLLLFGYLSYVLCFEKRRLQLGLFGLLFVSGVLVQSKLWNLNTVENREVKAMYFGIGKFTETSAHFLSFNPVLDSIQKHKIGKISTVQDFFIGNVFRFYKAQYPEIKTYNNVMNIEYDYYTLGTGFRMPHKTLGSLLIE